MQGLESTCGVLELASGEVIALPPVEIRPSGDKFDYKSKYLAKDTVEICPASFAPEVNAALQDQALKAHKALGGRGYSRSDFIVSEHGLVYLETNTLPGLTASSLYPKALKARGSTSATSCAASWPWARPAPRLKRRPSDASGLRQYR